ncbi:MAG: hypothetical protein WA919_07570 [Coleofasciculaceae cyanobacterium]
MRLKPIELFLALGLAATITACDAETEGGDGAEPGEVPTEQTVPEAAPEAEEGGEGGEG